MFKETGLNFLKFVIQNDLFQVNLLLLKKNMPVLSAKSHEKIEATLYIYVFR